MKRFFMLLIAGLFVLSFSGTASAAAQTGPVTIDGHVSLSGLVADNCKVFLQKKPTGFANANRTTYTDGAGYFVLTDPSIKAKNVAQDGKLKATWEPEFYGGLLKLQFTGTTVFSFPPRAANQDVEINEDIEIDTSTLKVLVP